jgi:drug/metabolite transporter (DMT)-like permease
LLGLPIMLVYLALVREIEGGAWPTLTWQFFVFCLLTAMTQNAATAALLTLLKLRSFAVASQMGRSDMIFTAIIGASLLGQSLSWTGWLALMLASSGLGVLMLAKVGQQGVALSNQVVGTGLFVGLMYGICNLTLRQATLQVDGGSAMLAAALTVVVVTAIQMVMLGLWLARNEPETYRAIGLSGGWAAFVGVTSALGSIGWFTAFALEKAALVRIVGQIEIVFTLAVSVWYFRERPTQLEFVGIVLTVAGIIVFAMA